LVGARKNAAISPPAIATFLWLHFCQTRHPQNAAMPNVKASNSLPAFSLPFSSLVALSLYLSSSSFSTKIIHKKSEPKHPKKKKKKKLTQTPRKAKYP
jgi:hypothetical protein